MAIIMKQVMFMCLLSFKCKLFQVAIAIAFENVALEKVEPILPHSSYCSVAHTFVNCAFVLMPLKEDALTLLFCVFND